MTKYHISQDGKERICRAQSIDTCKAKKIKGLDNHFESKEDAKQAYAKFMEIQLPKINKSLNIKKQREYSTDQKEIQSIEPESYSLSLSMLKYGLDISVVDYDYNYVYTEDGGEYLDEDSIHINSVNDKELALELTKYNNKDTDKILEIMRQHGTDDVDNYIVDYSYTSYGHDFVASFVNSDALIKDLENYYYSKPNAIDKDGILEYVRSKGVETQGLKPFDALMKQFRDEYGNRESQYVNRSNNVSQMRIKNDRIVAGAREHYKNVEPHDVKSFNSSRAIAGVVFYDKNYNVYRLIDGYHRRKHMLNNNVDEANYIILSE